MPDADTLPLRIETRDGLRLIVPLGDAVVGNAGWTLENRWLRSRIETDDGRTVSQGFGKFFNLGQGPEPLRVDAARIIDAAAKGDAVATLKLDGTLLIRSVWRGSVVLRTRGAWACSGLANAAEVDDFRRRHPVLDDVGFRPDLSLLFEWTTPANRIVLGYDRPGLTLVGAVRHGPPPEYVRLSELVGIADELGCPLVEHHPLTTDGWAAMLERIRTDRRIEGFVVRLDGEQTLVKVKADAYLKRHACRSGLGTSNLTDLWIEQGEPQRADFTRWFAGEFDEEICIWGTPVFDALFAGAAARAGVLERLRAEVDGLRHLPRKDFAIEMQARHHGRPEFGIAMSWYLGREPLGETLAKVLRRETRPVLLRMFGGPDGEE